MRTTVDAMLPDVRARRGLLPYRQLYLASARASGNQGDVRQQAEA